jgi:type IV pilus assembly protein PilM
MLFDIMDLFSGKKPLVGLDIGSSSLKLVEIEETPKGFVLNRYCQIPLPKGVIVDGTPAGQEELTAGIKEIFKQSGCRRRSVVTSLSGQSVIVKKVSLANMEETELRDLIKDEATKYLPFDSMEGVNFDFQILGGSEFNPNLMDVLLVAAKKDIIDGYAEAVKNAGFNLVILDVDTFALETMYEENYDVEDEDVIVIINVGASVTNINVVKNGTSVFTRDFALGGNTVTEAIQSGLGLTFEEAERIKIEGKGGDAATESAFYDSLLAYADPLCQEIERSVDYFRSTYGGGSIKYALLAGGGAKLPGIAAALTQRLNIPTEIANPFRKIRMNEKNIDPSLMESIGPGAAVGVGLALRRLGDK